MGILFWVLCFLCIVEIIGKSRSNRLVRFPSPVYKKVRDKKRVDLSSVQKKRKSQQVVDKIVNTTLFSPSSTLRIGVVTWNLAEKLPTASDCLYLKELRNCDMVVVACQECRHPIADPSFAENWAALQRRILGRRYETIGRSSLGGMQLSVFARCTSDPVKSSHNLTNSTLPSKYDLPPVRLVGSSIREVSVACGIGNVFANKGATGLFLQVGKTRLGLANVHLAAHQHQVTRRNVDLARILKVICEESFIWNPIKLKKKRRKSSSNLLDGTTLDALIVMGDFNYRVDLPRLEIEQIYEESRRSTAKVVSALQTISSRSPLRSGDSGVSNARHEYHPSFLHKLPYLQQFDQLSIEMVALPWLFGKLREPWFPQFPPTFKYDLGGDCFDTSSKARCPAWTDRVLFTPALHPHTKDILQPIDYYAIDSRASDHRPVVAVFNLTISAV